MNKEVEKSYKIFKYWLLALTLDLFSTFIIFSISHKGIIESNLYIRFLNNYLSLSLSLLVWAFLVISGVMMLFYILKREKMFIEFRILLIYYTLLELFTLINNLLILFVLIFKLG